MQSTLLPTKLNQNTYYGKVIKTLAEFKDQKQQWDGLMQDCSDYSISLSYHWILSYLEHFPGLSPFIVMVYDGNGKLVGVAPFKINISASGFACRLLRRVQFIGTDPSVYDSIWIPCYSKVNQEWILREIVHQLLLQKKHWDLVDLRYMKHLEQAEILSNLFKPFCFTGAIFSTMNNPSFILPANLQEYEQNRKKNQKKNIRNIMNRLKNEYPQDSLVIEFIPPSPKYEHLMDFFVDKHIKYWKERDSRSDFERYPELKSFYKTIHYLYNAADNPEQCSLFSILKLGCQIVSYQVCFWQGSSFLGHLTIYNSEYKKFSPGLLHTDTLIQSTILRQGKLFSFGRGNELYKGQWTDHYDPLWDILFFKSRWAYWSWQIDMMLRRLV